MHATALVAPLLFALASCQNSFLAHYRGTYHEETSSPALVDSEPSGTVLIGQAHFVSADGEGATDVLRAARKVGADFVRWNAEYQGTTQSSGAIPVTTPTTSTTYFHGNTYGNVYSGGYAGSYTANTFGSATTLGSQTTYMPYTVVNHWVKHSAWFYRRAPDTHEQYSAWIVRPLDQASASDPPSRR